MTLVIESVVLCVFFTIMVYIMSREPIKTLYNYPPKIQERVKSLKQYKGKIPTEENKITTKISALIIFLIIMCVILRYVNGCTTFKDAFLNGFILWTVVNLNDLVVLDILWFCHDPYFVLKGTEDMVDEYHNYWFHTKGFFIGEGLAIIVCLLASLIIHFIL